MFNTGILRSFMWVFCVVLVGFFPFSLEQDEDIPHNEVKNWALKFGVDLWEFGTEFTKMKEIRTKYRDVNVDVVRKDGLILIREMAAEVKNMMDFKMSAVMRIMDSAEQAALSPKPNDNGQSGGVKYYNSRRLNVFGPDGRVAEGAREMTLTPNRHFDQLPVNTSLSSVLMPPVISDTDPDITNAIQWSEHLDRLFVNNYETDPSLSWQYFGSSTGFLRRYPAMAWPPEEMSSVSQRSRHAQDVYDFRHSAWFINAATSPKDLVILIDASGSMTGQRQQLAKATAIAILDTLSDNDFVNIFKFSESTEALVPCFNDVLIQANDKNKREQKSALDSIKPENIANFTSALVTAFEILRKYNSTHQGSQCNQAIMLITDGPPSTFQEIFQTYNMPHKLVRMFTYLVGKDSGNANEMNWMACNNKGFYTRISTMGEVKEKVLNYISVMARPMVMYQNNHPILWTPAYLGGKGSTLSNDAKPQLMTSVTTPVFDRRNHSVRVANLLGVVGTDVPIDQIIKLVPPYKLGVNGYSFIVDNNGHVLYHPDLRPLYGNDKYEESLEPVYSSVDLTEVELVENDSGPRENNSLLLDLRHDMIEQKEGETELNVKVHYDNMKRVTTRRHKYFYNPIEGTPFSLGLAIPEGYGMYEVLAEQEIKHSPVNVSEYFKGTNWRVHPDWVYCEYSSATEQWIGTPEERVLHFLSRSRAPGWKWMSLRPRAPPFASPMGALAPGHMSPQHLPATTHKKTDKELYYCDKTLLQSLVLDAKVTEDLDKHNPHSNHKEEKQQGYQMFGVTLSFIATRSGLLRWTEHATPIDTREPHFSEGNTRATDEIWYKRAVDQHTIEPESFVFSVPFDSGNYHGQPGKKPLITATHAVFVEHKGHRAPVAVVGLQFQHSVLHSHFINITSTCSQYCRKTCAADEMDCYVLDDNGFIILSENPEHTGKFFGQIDGTIMDSLVQDRIYKKVAVYDYQGACSSVRNPLNAAGKHVISACYPMKWLWSWITETVLFWLSTLNTSYGAAFPYANDDDTQYNEEYEPGLDDDLPPDSFNPSIDDRATEQEPSQDPGQIHNQGATATAATHGAIAIAEEDATPRGSGARPCDKRVDLYILQPDRLNTSGMSNPLKGKLTNCHVSGCERPFSVQKIPHSNLILLVVDTVCPCGNKQLSIGAHEIIYETEHCRSKNHESLHRRKPPKCINYHPEEVEITICGKANKAIGLSIWVIMLPFFNIFT